MAIQIFGTKQCNETRKAERFFKERRIPYQMINLAEKAMSRGELKSVTSSVGIEALIDPSSKEYKKHNLQYMKFSLEEKLLELPLIMKTPVVRDGKRASVGYKPEVWESWQKDHP